jgi:MFS family permease
MLPLYALSTILMIGYAAVFTLLAEMRSSFGFSETAIGAIAGSAFLAGFIAQLLLSRFADSGHGKHLLRLGVVTALVGLVWMCFADDLTGWIAARTILGFGAGCVRPAARRLAFVHQPEVAGKTLGRLAAAEMIGFLIGCCSTRGGSVHRLLPW